MKNPAPAQPPQKTLLQLVKRITLQYLPSAARRHSLVINDVPGDLPVNTDEHLLAAVFENLLDTVISHTANSCIRISAKPYGQFVLLHVKESHRVLEDAFRGTLRPVQQLAEKLGATISVNEDRDRATTILFSFLNSPVAA